jgi:hypothetical protein
VDAHGFARLAKIVFARGTRRGTVAALLGGALSLLGIADSGAPDAVARKKARTRRRASRHVIIQGPCGDGGPRHNACKHDGQCCTGSCRKRRCRCRRLGQPCTEDRHCCPSHQGMICQNGSCALPDGGGECSPGAARPCYSGPAGTENVGICRSGSQQCLNDGNWGACQGEVLPQTELCNGLDDDCDGVVDDGVACPGAPNATVSCLSGQCRVVECAAGFADCDGDAASGCETNIATDVRNCGGCGIDCTGTCSGGGVPACVIGACHCL